MKSFVRNVVFAALAVTSMPSAADASGWSYGTDEDKMRNTKYEYAEVSSPNVVDFDFPYQGGSNLTLLIWKKNGELHDIRFVISKGQFVCSAFACEGAMKFGDKAVDSLSLLPPSDHSGDIVFVKHDAAFLRNLRKHNKLVVELEFYREGRKQFQFDISGLKF